MPGWIEYDSNNSGGSFWLKDEDWKALEDAGWHVNWVVVTERKAYSGPGIYTSARSGRRYGKTWDEATRPFVAGDLRWPDSDSDERVVAVADSYDDAVALRERYGGYLGTLAVSCAKKGQSAQALVDEFERITGQNAADAGCGCDYCGPPHSFEWHDDDGSSSYGYAVVAKTELAWS